MKYLYALILLTLINVGVDVAFKRLGQTTLDFEGGIVCAVATLWMWKSKEF